MWTTISTETAQFLFDSLADFQYRVGGGEGPSYDEWEDYFHLGKVGVGYISPERLAVLCPRAEFRVEAE